MQVFGEAIEFSLNDTNSICINIPIFLLYDVDGLPTEAPSGFKAVTTKPEVRVTSYPMYADGLEEAMDLERLHQNLDASLVKEAIVSSVGVLYGL